MIESILRQLVERRVLEVRTNSRVERDSRKILNRISQFNFIYFSISSLKKKFFSFTGIKGQKRIMQDLELREAEKKKEQRESLGRTIEKFENILQQIKEFCHETDIDR